MNLLKTLDAKNASEEFGKKRMMLWQILVI